MVVVQKGTDTGHKARMPGVTPFPSPQALKLLFYIQWRTLASDGHPRSPFQWGLHGMKKSDTRSLAASKPMLLLPPPFHNNNGSLHRSQPTPPSRS